MSPTSLEQIIPVLRDAIGPVILISGVGLLLLTMTNRLGRAIDRARQLQNELAGLAQAFRVGIIQGELYLQLGFGVGLHAIMLDEIEGAPVQFVLALGFALDGLIEGINEKIVEPQEQEQPEDPKDQEPSVHGAERISSGNFIPEHSVELGWKRTLLLQD